MDIPFRKQNRISQIGVPSKESLCLEIIFMIFLDVCHRREFDFAQRFPIIFTLLAAIATSTKLSLFVNKFQVGLGRTRDLTNLNNMSTISVMIQDTETSVEGYWRPEDHEIDTLLAKSGASSRNKLMILSARLQRTFVILDQDTYYIMGIILALFRT